jgi:DNA polymerase (family 10)
MQLDQATAIAERVKAQLAPHCARIEIAGSIRRRKPTVGDIEIVAIPKPYDVGLFADGIAPIVNQWPKVRGELPCKYTQRMLPDGIALDLFFATPDNWGLIFAIRTGSAEYAHHVLACGWVRNGYRSVGGTLMQCGRAVTVREERDLFGLAGVEWVPPEARTWRAGGYV